MHKTQITYQIKSLIKRSLLFSLSIMLAITSLAVLIAPNTMAYPGELDTGFNLGVSGFDEKQVWTTILQPDGKILVGGGFTLFNGVIQNRLIRLNPDGSKDSSFNMGGSGFDSNVIVTTTLQPDGKILVGGSFTSFNGNTQDHQLIRLNPDGSKDTTFNLGVTGFNNTVILTTTLQPDGKILVGGDFSSFNGIPQGRLIRLNPDGSKDPSFNLGGSGFDNIFVRTTALQPDGKILVGGAYTSFNGIPQGRLIRLNPDGSKDSSFNLGGSGFDNNNVVTTALQPDGKILVGGTYTSFNGIPQGRLIRLNPDGSKDPSFNLGGSGFDNNFVYITILQPDGKILVGGDFTSFNGNTQDHRLVRLNSDGSKDTTLNLGTTGFDNINVIAVTLQPDGKILVGGGFTSFNGNTKDHRLVRLYNTDDKDADGLDDTLEDSVANSGDANNDSILDSNQNNVSSFINPITNKTSSIQVDPTCTLSSLSTKEESSLNNQDSTYSYPLGLYDFTASCGTPGYTTTVKLYNYDTPNTSSYITRKYNPNTKLYSDLTGSYLEDITINNQTVKVSNYSLTDGSDNDTDGLTNGIIVDPVGLATITTTTTNTTPMAPNTGVGRIDDNYIYSLLIFTSLSALSLFASLRHKKQ